MTAFETASPTRPWTLDEFEEAVDGLAPVAVRAAATLRVADHVAGGAVQLLPLAACVGAEPDLLRRLMRFLTCRGVFEEPEPDVYGLTDLSMTLLDGHPGRLRAWLDAGGIGSRMDRAVHGLLEAVRTGEPTYPRLYGRDFYADLADTGLGPDFDELRGDHAVTYAKDVAEADLWADRSGVVDVGGGTGVLLEQVLLHHPHLHGALVDLPDAVTAAARRLVGSPVAKRFTPVPGSFFDPLPGGDAHVLVNVLHNWDESATRILRRCREAAAPSGRVYVVEQPTDGADARTASAMDLRMFLFCGGRERSRADFARLGAAAGLALVAEEPLPYGLRVLQLEPAGSGGAA